MNCLPSFAKQKTSRIYIHAHLALLLTILPHFEKIVTPLSGFMRLSLCKYSEIRLLSFTGAVFH